MNNKERADLVKLFSGLSNKLRQIAGDCTDETTEDELNELIEVIDESAAQLVFNRN